MVGLILIIIAAGAGLTFAITRMQRAAESDRHQPAHARSAQYRGSRHPEGRAWIGLDLLGGSELSPSLGSHYDPERGHGPSDGFGLSGGYRPTDGLEGWSERNPLPAPSERSYDREQFEAQFDDTGFGIPAVDGQQTWSATAARDMTTLDHDWAPRTEDILPLPEDDCTRRHSPSQAGRPASRGRHAGPSLDGEDADGAGLTPDLTSAQLAEQLLAEAEAHAAQMWRQAREEAVTIREAAEHDAAAFRERTANENAGLRQAAERDTARLRQEAANQAAALRAAVEQEIVELRQQAADQAVAIKQAAEQGAAALRATLMDMSAELGRVAAHLSGTLGAVPATHPGGPSAEQDRTEPSGQVAEAGEDYAGPLRPPARPSPPAGRRSAAAKPSTRPRPRTPDQTRQYMAARRMAVGTAAIVVFAFLLCTADPVGYQSLSSFGFRGQGIGAAPLSALPIQQSGFPPPVTHHQHPQGQGHPGNQGPLRGAGHRNARGGHQH
ncbi:MAG TPA: hypothetical protein VGS19_01470 [Streptosporangiaceae bacterium]|nr:hypothetical protein [Streptosporangiaceae bacterium]